MRMLTHALALAMLAGSFTASARSHEHGSSSSGCAASDTALGCAAAATPAFAPDGSLHLVWSAGGRVMAARSTDDGRTLSVPVAVNAAPETIDANGEARPVVAVDSEGRVAIAYAVRGAKGFTGRLWLSHSPDGGRSFAPPRPATNDIASQRFPNLIADRTGRLHLTWIDKRPSAGHERKQGALLMTAVSTDGGASLRDERVVAEPSCECCRVAVASAGDGGVLLLWRHIFPPNIRDHAIMAIAPDGRPGPLLRVAEDGWAIDACPHHGPALGVDGAGNLHAAWFTGGRNREGLFYARGTPDGDFSSPRPIGDADRAPSHPQLWAEGQLVWLVWKEFDGQTTRVIGQHSEDGGAAWSTPRSLAETGDASDHPLLVDDGRGRLFLSWLTRSEGWRLLPLPGGGA